MSRTLLPPADVAAVVLNWNNADDTLACLMSLRESTVAVAAVVVDNASTDGSAEMIEASGLADVILRNPVNLGFAGGNNVGLRYALAQGFPAVMVLNNDTVITPAATRQLLDAVRSSEDARAVSPRIVYYDDQGEVWFAGGVIDRGFPRHLRADEVAGRGPGLHRCELLSGCCILATAATWRRVGEFDERYFLIFEDSDWSMRAAREGIGLFVEDRAVVAHRVSRSFRTGPSALLGDYYFARNGLRFHLTWQRRHLMRFLREVVARPTARAALRRRGRRAAFFRVLGTAACSTGQTGAAGTVSRKLAVALTSSERRRVNS